MSLRAGSPLLRRLFPGPACGFQHRMLGAVWCVGLVVAGLGSVASAHQQFAPSTVNRYSKLAASQTHGVRLHYTLMVGDAPALGLRSQADRSHDGHLDAAEQAQLCAHLGRLAQSGINLWIDQQPQMLTWEPAQCTLSGRVDQGSDTVAALPIAVDLVLRQPVRLSPAIPHLVRYEDRAPLSPVGEVELRIEEGPDLTLIESWQGTEPHVASRAPAAGTDSIAVQRVFQTVGPARSSMSDRSVSLRLAPAHVSPMQPASRRRSAWWLALTLGGAGVGLWLIQRARTRVPRSG